MNPGKAFIVTLLLFGCTNKPIQPENHGIEGSLLGYRPDKADQSASNMMIGEWSICSTGTDSTQTMLNGCPRVIFREYGAAEVNFGGVEKEPFYWNIRNDTLYITYPAGSQDRTFADGKYTFEFSEGGEQLKIIDAGKFYFYLGRLFP